MPLCSQQALAHSSCLRLGNVGSSTNEHVFANEALRISDNGKSSMEKAMMLYGHPPPVYERALRGHGKHNEMHDYPMYVLREQTTSGVGLSKAWGCCICR